MKQSRDPNEPRNRQTEPDRKRAKTGDKAVGVYQDGRRTPSTMSRFGTILMAVALVSALLAVPLGVSAVAADEPTATEAVAPGERLAGVVGIQQAAVDGDLSERRYAARLDRADSDAERAAIVDERREEIERRLAAHEAELAELRAARDAGNITEGTYRARVATLAAEKGSTERAAARASETARQLPAAVRQARGISVESFQELRANASRLGGPETAAIAREIGGPNASRPAVEPRESARDASTLRNTSGQPRPTDDGAPAADGGQAGSSDRSTAGSARSPGSVGTGSRPSANDPGSQQRGPSDTAGQQDTVDPNGPPESTDRQGGAARDTDNQGSNGQRPTDR